MYKKRILGAVSVLTENSNHNSDFDGPRKVDGVFVASDKSLKFYVRHFLSRNGEIVFYKKTLNDDGSAKLLKNRVEDLNIKEKRDYFDCVDNKFFGFTLLIGDKNKLNCTLAGPVQITYGKNIYKDNNYVNHTITSQFSSKEGSYQTTIGNEHKVNKANYLHSFRFNPNSFYNDSLFETKEFEDMKVEIKEEEVEKMKNAFSHCIGSSLDGSYSSSSKSNTKIGLTVFVTLKEGCTKNIDIDSTITCDEFNVYDLTKLTDYLSQNRDNIDKVDISYHKNVSDIKNIENIKSDDMFNIFDEGYEIAK